jgi:hypothetical protein
MVGAGIIPNVSDAIPIIMGSNIGIERFFFIKKHKEIKLNVHFSF